MARLPARVALLACALAWSAPVAAQDQPSAAATESLTLRTSLKASVLAARAPDDPALYPDRDSVSSFWRLRLQPEARHGERLLFVAAYEQRLRAFTQSTGLAGSGVLPPDTPAPYRLAQLDWQLARSPNVSWRHEIDRASVALHLRRADVTIGRQAVGWGRGVLFGAVDLFSPFTPLEADREWRRGVDAIRTDVKLADHVSLEGVGAFGPSLDSSIAAARLRGYARGADLEVVGGWRARDLFAGVTSSAPVGGAEVHGEVAVFRLPEALPLDPANRQLVLKAVVGGSYRFPIGWGLLVYAEYHYSGFGAASASDILPLLSDPEYRERYFRGDTQILSRHALAVLGSQELSPELALAGQWLHSPSDGSGVVTPSLTITFSDGLSLALMTYVPYGRPPEGLELQSEYGAAALSAFVQLRMYR